MFDDDMLLVKCIGREFNVKFTLRSRALKKEINTLCPVLNCPGKWFHKSVILRGSIDASFLALHGLYIKGVLQESRQSRKCVSRIRYTFGKEFYS